MELRQLEAFVTVAETASFTHAARRLQRSQASVSQQIRLLEERLGEPLLIRTNRRVQVSARGKELLPEAQELLRLRAALFATSRREGQEVTGRLTVGTSSAATAYLWARMYKAFAERYPGVELDIRTMQRTQDTIDQVTSGDLDVGFVPLPLHRAGLETRALGYQRALLAVPPGHRLAGARTVHPSKLGGEPFLLYEPQMSTRWLTDEFFRKNDIVPRVILESNDTHLIKAMVLVGFGLAFLPDWSCERELKERLIRSVEIRGTRLVQELGLVFRRRQPLPLPARLFTEFCVEHQGLLPRTAQRPGGGHAAAE